MVAGLLGKTLDVKQGVELRGGGGYQPRFGSRAWPDCLDEGDGIPAGLGDVA